MKKPFEKLNKERAIDIRSRIDGLDSHPGYVILKTYFEERAKKLRAYAPPIMNDDFTTLNKHNRKIYLAEAFEEVLLWLQDAKAQCDSVVEGESR